MCRLRLAGRLLTNNAPSGLLPPYIDMLFHITKIYVATCSFPRTAHIRRDAKKEEKKNSSFFLASFYKPFSPQRNQTLKNMVGNTEYQQVAQLLEINVMDPNPNPNQKFVLSKLTNIKEIFIFNKTNATYIFLDLTDGLLGSRKRL
jgi:hypothetical protein